MTHTLAGHPTATGCADDDDPEQVRFGHLSGITTDGSFLYVADPGCGSGAIRRVLLGSGETDTLTALADVTGVVVGFVGELFALTPTAVYRVDTEDGTSTLIATAADEYTAITLAGQYVWLADGGEIKTLDRLNDDAETTVADLETPVTAMEGAGNWLYLAIGADGSQILRYDTSQNEHKPVAGSLTSGFKDGTGVDAAFDQVVGIATDRESMLYVADSGNHRVRSIAHDQFFAEHGHAFGLDGYGAWEGGVNAGLGAYVTSNTDFDIATSGPGLGVTRTYNSRDFYEGAFGVGWSFEYEMRWRRDGAGNVAILYPDGRREIYEKQGDGSFETPKGYFSELETDGDGYVLTARDDTVHTFDEDGRLTQIADRNGRTLTLAYDDGKLDVVTDDASGRTLTFAWADDRIATVSTQSVAEHDGSLTWAYYYDTQGRLVQACDPRDNTQTTGVCWKYEWSDEHQITRVTKPEGNIEAEIEYGWWSPPVAALMAGPMIVPPAEPGVVVGVTDGEGNKTEYDNWDGFEARTTDPRGYVTVQTYDERFRLVKERDPQGKITTFGYNAQGHRDYIKDGSGNVVQMTFDERGNRTSDTNSEFETTYMEYDEDDNLVARRDGRSANAGDNTYATVYDYDNKGNKTSETDPEGNEQTWEYTDGTETAIGGGTMPAGLVAREVTPRGNEATPADFATVYEYDSKGDLRQVATPSGLVTTYTYDAIGRRLTETVIDTAAGTTATTTTSYDKAGNELNVTGPPVDNEVTTETHQSRTVNVYDHNSNLESSTIEDLEGDDPDRVTAFTYDNNDRQKSVTDPEGGVLSRAYDEAGNVVKVTDQEGRVVVTAYNSRNQPVKVTARNFVDDPIGESSPRHVVTNTYTYDAAGRKRTETDAEGRVTRYTYDRADRETRVELLGYVDGNDASRTVVLSQKAYDKAGNLLSETVGNGTAGRRTTTYAYDKASRLVETTFDPQSVNRVTMRTLDANGNVTVQVAVESGRTETITSTFDEADRLVSQVVENGTVDLETTYGYDERGNQTAVTDPRGNLSGATAADYTTTSRYDEASRLVEVVSPEVEIDGGPATATPTVVYGYNTSGDRTHEQDTRGNVTVSDYDRLGRVVEIHHPPYTPPAEMTPITATEEMEYDRVGNLTERVSRRSETTTYVFDDFNRVVAQIDPLVDGETEPGKVRYQYDDVGNQTAVVEQNGARTETAYDKANRPRTQTVYVRQQVGEPLEMVTVFDHDDLGNQTYVENPEGDITRHVYNAAGNLVSTTDPLNKVTSYQWQHDRQTRVTDPLGRYTVNTYDLAGRLTMVRRYSPTDTLVTTTGHAYDAAGNRTATTSPRGHVGGAEPADFTTVSTFDALNRLTAIETPITDSDTIVTGHGYDPAGNLTVFTDGNSNTTTYTYNPWNLRESTVEPATTAHTSASDRTWTTTYDAGGLPVAETLPGGVTVARTFDELGRLVEESGSGDGTATKEFGYDLAGNQTSVSHPDGTIGYAYDDRRLLVAQTGPAGTATFAYDDAGRLTQRVDAAGTHTYTWTPRSELETLTDPLTATTLDYTWDYASQLTAIAYGTAGAERTLTYDHLGRLTADTLTDDTSATASRVDYAYDPDGNVISRDVVLPGNDAEGLHEYEYDNSGRLISWEHDTELVDYEWDDSGNRTGADTDAYTYDERNRLMSGPDGDYTYTPRGTLAEVDDGITPVEYVFDPLGRLVSRDDIDYTYDALDRVATRDTEPFAYQGFSLDPVADDTALYARTPAGHLVAVSDGVDDLLVGVDRHGDVTHLHTPDGTITDTALYDPFGDPLDTTGDFHLQVGYQGDWTDPTSGHVWMGARWYDGGWANFLSRDTVFGELSTPISLNRYTYAWANPLAYWDPLGMYTAAINKFAGEGSHFAGAAKKTKPANGSKATTRPRRTTSATGRAAATVRAQSLRRGNLTAARTAPVNRPAPSRGGMRDFGSGFGSHIRGTVEGLGETLNMAYKSGGLNLLADRKSFVNQWKTNFEIAGAVISDPVGFADQAFIEPFRATAKPWQEGRRWESVGIGAAAALEVALARGAGRALSATKVSTGVTSHLDDLVPGPLQGGPSNVHVYQGISNNKPVYAGITNDLSRRASEHGSRFDFLEQVTSSPVTRGQARAIEEALYLQNPGYQNMLHSISPKHPWYQQAVDWGESWLSTNK